MAELDDLKDRRAAITAILKAGQTPGGQSLDEVDQVLDGESITVGAYVQRLYNELERINKLIPHMEGKGWIIASKGST